MLIAITLFLAGVAIAFTGNALSSRHNDLAPVTIPARAQTRRRSYRTSRITR